MKKVLSISIFAFVFAACAPNNTISNLEMDFAPASPLGSRVTGSGSVVSSSSGNSRIRLELRGLPASSSLGTAVYVGSCTNQGHLSLALPDVRSDAAGNASLETSVVNGTIPTQAYVNVFQKTRAEGYGTALACSNLK
jgi:hypothetical protein